MGEGLNLVSNNIVSYNFLSSSNINILFGGVEGSPSSLTYMDPSETDFYLSTSITSFQVEGNNKFDLESSY